MPASHVVINEYSGVRLDERTRASGRRGYSLTIASEPVAVLLDAQEMARAVAEELAATLRKQARAITATVSAATYAARKKAAKAFAAGETWAVKRYSGGRTGATPPGTGNTFGVDSGRLADGIVARANPSEGGFTVNAPANRFDREGFGDPTAFDRWIERWVELVPALRHPLDDLGIQRKIREVNRATIQKLAMANAEKQGQLIVSALRGLARLVA